MKEKHKCKDCKCKKEKAKVFLSNDKTEKSCFLKDLEELSSFIIENRDQNQRSNVELIDELLIIILEIACSITVEEDVIPLIKQGLDHYTPLVRKFVADNPRIENFWK